MAWPPTSVLASINYGRPILNRFDRCRKSCGSRIDDDHVSFAIPAPGNLRAALRGFEWGRFHGGQSGCAQSHRRCSNENSAGEFFFRCSIFHGLSSNPQEKFA